MAITDDHAALLFAIGPVQDFIATARKGQDLWFGSWLLSELSREAANTALREGAELILPDPDALEHSVANKIVARVRATNAAEVAAAMEAAVRKRLDDLAQAVFDSIEISGGKKWLKREAAAAQIRDLPEIYWVTVEEAVNWGETRRRAEAALAARKSLRAFDAVTWGAPVPKSQLDGQRESVIDESAFGKRASESHAERLRKSLGVDPSERLCGVGLLKRNGRRALPRADSRSARVISTSHVASWSLRRAWADQDDVTELENAFKNFCNALPDNGSNLSQVPADSLHRTDPVIGRFDGQVLFANRLGDVYEESDLPAARQALECFLTAAKKAIQRSGKRPPALSPYYALLRADGDRMGAWLDGLSEPSAHREASKVLGEFAKSAEEIIAKHHGHCIFAGGDDVLALVPVATVLDCAEALNQAFTQTIARGPKGSSPMPTLSVGIQVAHAMDPFRNALAGAKEAEHAAKQTYDRAAFAVRVDKRSGTPIVVGGKWDALPALRELQLLQDVKEGVLPRGLAYDLRGVADRLESEEEPSSLATIRGLEVERVLAQKELPKSASDALWNRLGSRDVDASKLRTVCDELLVSRALAGMDREAL